MQNNKDSFKKVNLISPIDIKMNFWQKLGWRIKFILFESWNKDLGVIIFYLKSANKRGAAALTEYLDKFLRPRQ